MKKLKRKWDTVVVENHMSNMYALQAYVSLYKLT